MRSAKERKIDKKRRAKETNARKTEESRARRLDNKAKRAEIHAIDPDMKVKVIDQVTHDEDGAVIKVENGKITKWLPLAIPEIFKPETVEVFDAEAQVVEEVEATNVSKLRNIFKKW